VARAQRRNDAARDCSGVVMKRRRPPTAFCAYVVREPGGVVYGLSGEHDAVHGQSGPWAARVSGPLQLGAINGTDAVWAAADGPSRGFLCVGCLERRLGPELTSADFSDVSLNRDAVADSARLRDRKTRPLK
jgi:hypothetical protein